MSMFSNRVFEQGGAMVTILAVPEESAVASES